MTATQTDAPAPIKALSKPVARPISDILTDLAQPIPARLLAHRKQGNAELSYLPWHRAVKMLDFYAPGWSGAVVSITTAGDRLIVVYRITIVAQEGSFSREATGQEKLDCGSYGDPSSNAESMAFRRAAAKFGLGLHLYEKGD